MKTRKRKRISITTKMKTKKKRKRMKRIGSSVFLCLLLSVPWAAHADKKPKEKASAQPYAVLGGTVFRESGYALPGADVMIAPDPQSGQIPVKIQYPRAISDNRGEFAFRVPATAMRYTVSAKAKGFEARQKSADIEGEVRIDVTLVLPAVSK
jgi:hypothetical protein